MLNSAAASASAASAVTLACRRCLSAGSGAGLKRMAAAGLPGFRRRPDPLAALSQLEVGPPELAESRRERHLPLTKASLLRLLSKEAGVGSGDLQQLAESLDNALANRFYGNLRDLQQLYRPLNPDDDTSDNLLARRERLDSEFSFLQRLSCLLGLANFRELSAPELSISLRPRASPTGVTVSVDAGRYDVLRVWVIGRTDETDAKSVGLLAKVRKALGVGVDNDGRVYQRVVLAVRLRRSDRLAVKMFRNVPVDSIDMLLPEGNLLMSHLDRSIIFTTLSAGSLGLLFGFYAWKHHLPYIDWCCLATGLSLATAFRGLVTYKERKSRHLMQLNALIYHNCLSSNRPLLATLAERAEDEALKECLLCYCLLQSRPMRPAQLEQAAQDWATANCKADIDFDCSNSVDLLLSLGLIGRDVESKESKEAEEAEEESESALTALRPRQAIGQLPARPAGAHWLLTDQSDAFEKDRYGLLVDRERRRSGWQ